MPGVRRLAFPIASLGIASLFFSCHATTSHGTSHSTCSSGTHGLELAVSLTGNDSDPGTVDKPFATLERAREAVRTTVASGVPAGGIVVWIRGGVYERSAALELGAQDSGVEGSPVEWCGYPGQAR